jgi:hypothetical protein
MKLSATVKEACAPQFPRPSPARHSRRGLQSEFVVKTASTQRPPRSAPLAERERGVCSREATRSLAEQARISIPAKRDHDCLARPRGR